MVLLYEFVWKDLKIVMRFSSYILYSKFGRPVRPISLWWTNPKSDWWLGIPLYSHCGCWLPISFFVCEISMTHPTYFKRCFAPAKWDPQAYRAWYDMIWYICYTAMLWYELTPNICNNAGVVCRLLRCLKTSSQQIYWGIKLSEGWKPGSDFVPLVDGFISNVPFRHWLLSRGFRTNLFLNLVCRLSILFKSHHSIPQTK